MYIIKDIREFVTNAAEITSVDPQGEGQTAQS